MLVLALSVPFVLYALNRGVFSMLDPLPEGLLDADKPLYSNMYLTPNFKGEGTRYNFHRGIQSVKFSTNSLGLRSPELSEDKEIILFSGDSTLFGSHLNDNETVPFLVERMFDGKYSAVNAGVPGKAVPHNLLTLERFIERSKENKRNRLRYFVNWIREGDFEYTRSLEDVRERALKVDLPFKRRMMVRFPNLTSLAVSLKSPESFFFTRTALTVLFVDKKNYHFKPIGRERIIVPQVDAVFKRNLEYFRRIIEICRMNDIQLVHVIATAGYPDIIYPDSYSDRLAEIIVREGAEDVIKLKDYYNANPSIFPDIQAWDNDFDHFIAPASKLIAGNLYEFLKRHGL